MLIALPPPCKVGLPRQHWCHMAICPSCGQQRFMWVLVGIKPGSVSPLS